MDSKHKNELLEKFSDLLDRYEWGENRKSVRVGVLIETEKEKVIYEASERL